MPKLTLRALRANAKYSQAVAAGLLGVTQKTLSNWETGVSFPSQPYIDKICELYKVRYDDINFRP